MPASMATAGRLVLASHADQELRAHAYIVPALDAARCPVPMPPSTVVGVPVVARSPSASGNP
jgi:hypothetical protein